MKRLKLTMKLRTICKDICQLLRRDQVGEVTANPDLGGNFIQTGERGLQLDATTDETDSPSVSYLREVFSGKYSDKSALDSTYSEGATVTTTAGSF